MLSSFAMLLALAGTISGLFFTLGDRSRKVKPQVDQSSANSSVTPKRVLSPEVRKRIADAQKKRWEKAAK
jgi:hypothetical protein